VLDECLKLLHPVMPFITEELWDKTAEFGAKRDGFLMTAAWPDLLASYVDPAAEAEIGWLVELVTEIRSIRAEMNVPPSARLPLVVLQRASNSALLLDYRSLLVTLARLSTVTEPSEGRTGLSTFVVRGDTYGLSLAGFIDIEGERVRLGKELAERERDISIVQKKLSNPDFVSRAPEEVVEENRERLAEAQAAKAKLEAALARLETVA
jgi:valyl-tRNA synthetase